MCQTQTLNIFFFHSKRRYVKFFFSRIIFFKNVYVFNFIIPTSFVLVTVEDHAQQTNNFITNYIHYRKIKYGVTLLCTLEEMKCLFIVTINSHSYPVKTKTKLNAILVYLFLLSVKWN